MIEVIVVLISVMFLIFLIVIDVFKLVSLFWILLNLVIMLLSSMFFIGGFEDFSGGLLNIIFKGICIFRVMVFWVILILIFLLF